MKNSQKIFVVLAVVLTAVFIVTLKKPPMNSKEVVDNSGNSYIQIELPDDRVKLPILIDLGSDKCIPCKMMAPILEELSSRYSDKFYLEFIDVWKNPQEGKKYKVRLIPTQIFFDETGKEIFRHEGFYSKEDILGKWKELGFDLSGKE